MSADEEWPCHWLKGWASWPVKIQEEGASTSCISLINMTFVPLDLQSSLGTHNLWGETCPGKKEGEPMAMKGCAREMTRRLWTDGTPRLAPQHSIKAQASYTRPLRFWALHLHPVAVWHSQSFSFLARLSLYQQVRIRESSPGAPKKGLDSSWSEVAQSCPTLCDPMNCSLEGSSILGILQTRVLEWVAISFSKCLWLFIDMQ